MDEAEYKKAIPHTCTMSFEYHMRALLCWGITNRLVQQIRGIEGPQYCHGCPENSRAKRWEKVWWRKFKNNLL